MIAVEKVLEGLMKDKPHNVEDVIIVGQGFVAATLSGVFDALPGFILVGSAIIIVLRIVQQVYDLRK